MKILTFDIEEWFHILDNDSTRTDKQWSNYESRIHQNMETILQILDNINAKASFFVVGWVADKYPEVVKEIDNRGYEVGSHTHMHQLVYEQNKEEFYNDVAHSIRILEDITGKKVRMFRAPGFSITERNKWAFEVLYDLGIEIDSSVFPTGRAHGGMPHYGTALPSMLEYNGVQLKEFPINTHSFMGRKLIYSGGGYFRIIPYHFIREWTKKDTYVMSYIHPRDLDPNQPMIKELSLTRKIKSYVGLKSAKFKLEKWLSDFEFIDIAAADQMVDWNTVKKVRI